MNISKKIIDFLNKMKKIENWGDTDVELTEKQIKHIRKQNS